MRTRHPARGLALGLIALSAAETGATGFGIGDYLLLESLLAGPGGSLAPEAAPYDGNGDSDLDLADVALFQEDFVGPRVTQTQNSACLGPRDPSDDDRCGGDVVWMDVVGHTLHILHEGALYNCCPEGFEHMADFSGDTIAVQEIEVLVHPCFCLCCYEIETWIADLPSGTYTVAFCWAEWGGGTGCDVQVVVVS